jgi:ABC-type lipoprotein export system ATPase subunit
MNTILHCTGIKKNYRISLKRLDVLKGIDLELREGEMSYIVGRSGSGKSTLLHILGGLDRPSDGDVYFGKKKIYRMGERRLCEFRNYGVGFVFQFYHLIPELTVLENVMLPGRIARRKTSKVRAGARELIDWVGLTDRQKHLPRQLSGGEMQRVALARSLVNNPAIVFCDEPTGNLDEESAAMIYSLIEKLNKEKKQTFCIVTHEESLVVDKENVYRLRDGILIPKN